MSWIISLFMAGALLGSGHELPMPNHFMDEAPPAKDAAAQTEETERIEKTYPFDMQGRVELSNINGSVVVEAWDSPQISLVAVKRAESREDLEDIEVVIEADQNEFSVRTEFKAWGVRSRDDKEKKKYRKWSVDYTLKVPRTAYLDEIETVNGSVDVSETTNFTHVSTVNGDVNGKNLKGNARLSTVNGTVNADFSELSGESMISLSAVNGVVKLLVPSNTNATVKADSVNGSISNDFGLPVRKGKFVGRDLYGRIGTGDVKIKLSSVNGGLSINRKDDGGTPNPVENLLDRKTGDDFDDTFESDFEIQIGEMNEEFEVALAESAERIDMSEVQIEKALEAMESAMVDITPEIAVVSAEALKRATQAINQAEIAESLELEKRRIEAELAKASEAMYYGRSPFVVERSGTFNVGESPEVTIDARECNVTVKGWDKPEVSYTVRRLKRNADRGDVKVSANKNDSVVNINVSQRRDPVRKQSELLETVHVEVRVPRKSKLTIITDREIRLEGVEGELELNGGTGSINVRDAYGKLKVSSADGTIRIIGFRGDVWSRTAKGDLYLEGEFGKISSALGQGRVFLTLDDDANAVISSPVFKLEDAVAVNDELYRLGGIDLWKVDEHTMKVGKGKASYSFEIGKGELYVRPKSSMIVN